MKKLLFLGDSITDCYHSFDKENLGKGYVRMIAEKLEYDSGKIEVKNMGTEGFTLPALKRLWNLCCTEIKPDFITILIGINDVAVMKSNRVNPDEAFEYFKCNYEMLLKQIQLATDCPILLMEPFIFPHPAEFATWEPDVRKMNNIIREISKKYNVGFLPLWDRLSDAAEKYGYDKITLDGVHLTRKGHGIIAESWIEYFKDFNHIMAH